MSTTPLEKPLPAGRGRYRYTALGYTLRAVKALPAPLRERVLDSATGGMSADLPPFADILRLVEAAGGVPDGRRWQERLLAQQPRLQAVRTRDVSSDTGGRLRARLYLPPADAPTATAALVWVHGGAFVIGSLDQKEAHWPALELAAAGIPVLSVDYRMCLNGLHHPAPQDDVLTAWHWARAYAAELGVTADQLHLGGASAGGCLVAGAALRLRDQGQPLPASLYLAYPVLQGHLPPATPQAAGELASSEAPPDAWMEEMFANWAGPAAWDDPYIAPGLADPTGLPPTYLLTCGSDQLRRASEPYADRLREAAVPVWQDLLPGAQHAPLDRPDTPDGQQALGRVSHG